MLRASLLILRVDLQTCTRSLIDKTSSASCHRAKCCSILHQKVHPRPRRSPEEITHVPNNGMERGECCAFSHLITSLFPQTALQRILQLRNARLDSVNQGHPRKRDVNLVNRTCVTLSLHHRRHIARSIMREIPLTVLSPSLSAAINRQPGSRCDFARLEGYPRAFDHRIIN